MSYVRETNRSLVLPKISNFLWENEPPGDVYEDRRIKWKRIGHHKKETNSPSIDALKNVVLRMKLKNKNYQSNKLNEDEVERHVDKDVWNNSYGNIWQNDRSFVQKWIQNHKRDIETSITKLIKLSRYNPNYNTIVRERVFDTNKVAPSANSREIVEKLTNSPHKNVSPKLKPIHL